VTSKIYHHIRLEDLMIQCESVISTTQVHMTVLLLLLITAS